jgi:hypothetical protein
MRNRLASKDMCTMESSPSKRPQIGGADALPLTIESAFANHATPARRNRQAVTTTLPIVLGLPELEAAASIGVSGTKFRELVAAGLMPKPRVVGGKLSYDIDELRDAYKALPHQGEEVEDSWAHLAPKAASAG